METPETFAAARGLTDERDFLLSADTPLALLQERCGGAPAGMLAIPELLELVQHARRIGLRIARQFSAYDGEDIITGFVRISPRPPEAGGGCELLVESWQRSPAAFAASASLASYLDAIDRAGAEITARLDARQRIQTLGLVSPDGREFADAVREKPGCLWTDLVELQGVAHHQPLHWRLLDGAMCRLVGSRRLWRARLLPLPQHAAASAPMGFELLLISDEALSDEGTGSDSGSQNLSGHHHLFGRTLAPALRQPLTRIVANAETIRARLAGPLHHDYCDYAATIANAGQHLSSMLDDLADLEVVEADGFATIDEEVDLIDAAQKAIGILGVRARAKQITVVIEEPADSITASGEFRRVLQILINLIGNAIAYSPHGSNVTITIEEDLSRTAKVTVSDEGPGVTAEQAERIFEKFERLGRDSAGGSDSGSGLGLYISRRLARAMGGELSVASTAGKGAHFTLELPSAASPEI
ncbi:MAG: sensor histidine kinase [Erythrobacter sp.]